MLSSVVYVAHLRCLRHVRSRSDESWMPVGLHVRGRVSGLTCKDKKVGVSAGKKKVGLTHRLYLWAD